MQMTLAGSSELGLGDASCCYEGFRPGFQSSQSSCAGEQADMSIRARALGVVGRPEAGKAAKRLPLSLTCTTAPMLDLLGAPLFQILLHPTQRVHTLTCRPILHVALRP